MIGTSTTFWIDFKRPIVGVVPPPIPRFAHTSILSAPPLTALKKGFPKVRARAQKEPSEHTNVMADCTESTQTSISRLSGTGSAAIDN